MRHRQGFKMILDCGCRPGHLAGGAAAFAELARRGAAAIVVGVLALLALCCDLSSASAQLLQNGNLEQAGDGSAFAGWTAYRWEGDGKVSALEGQAFEGRRAAMIEGTGPGKIALFQAVALKACSYRLTAMVAGRDLHPGQWNQSAALHIAFDNGKTITEPLVRGDSGWRQVTLEFSTPASGKATIYFFNYGSGMLFVDSVDLRADPACASVPTRLSLAADEVAPLRYEPPPAPGDRLLAGYCSGSNFASRRVCVRLQGSPPEKEAARASGPRLLADFDRLMPFHKPSLLSMSPSWQLKPASQPGGKPVAELPAGSALSGDEGSGLGTDWTGYDRLELEVDNPGDAPIAVEIVIHDDKSTGYWSRVNWPTVASPGRSTLHVPLQVFVGEKSVIQERRRLDVAHIVRLVLAMPETLPAKSPPLLVERISLAVDPAPADVFPELIRLDAGPATAPVMPGFTPLPAATRYRADRGYGLSPDARIGREEDRRHPDDLLRDWISFLGGGIDIDLPNDTYHVWMMLEDAGYWEYYPSFAHRRVLAENRVVLDERRSAADFLSRYLRHADDEDWPGDDIWSRYVAARYKPLEFDIEVRDGQLNLRFDGDQDPHATTLSALVIYPTSKSAQGTAYLRGLWATLKRSFDRETRQVLPPLPKHAKPAGNFLNGALSVFQRDISLDVEATDWPSEAEQVSRLGMTMLRDEREVLMLGLYAHEDLCLTSVDLAVAGLAPVPLLVRYKHERANQDGSVYRVAPRVLDPLSVERETPLCLRAGQARSIWFDLHAPTNFEVGQHEGQLSLGFSTGATAKVPVTIEIGPWQLPPADIPIGYLGSAPTYPDTDYPAIDARRRQETGQVAALLATHGFTAATGGLGGPEFRGYNGARARVDFTRADISIGALIRALPLAELNTYMGLELKGLPLDVRHDTRSEYGRPYPQVLSDFLEAIRLHGQARGWPRLLHSIGDEPSGADIDRVMALGHLFKALPFEARSAAFTSIDRPDRDATARLAGAVDRLYLNSHSEAGIAYVLGRGSECSLYNQRGRYRRGVYLLKTRSLGCRGHLLFALSSVHADPWYDLDGREADLCGVFVHPDGRLRLAVDFLRYRQAVNDYRYLAMLDAMARKSPGLRSGQQAEKWIRDLLDTMKGESGPDDAWTAKRLNKLRSDVLLLMSGRTPQ